MIDHLPSKCEELSSTPSTDKEKFRVLKFKSSLYNFTVIP
jgi:hypothetical protein